MSNGNGPKQDPSQANVEVRQEPRSWQIISRLHWWITTGVDQYGIQEMKEDLIPSVTSYLNPDPNEQPHSDKELITALMIALSAHHYEIMRIAGDPAHHTSKKDPCTTCDLLTDCTKQLLGVQLTFPKIISPDSTKGLMKLSSMPSKKIN